jgi:hypothetical protein
MYKNSEVCRIILCPCMAHRPVPCDEERIAYSSLLFFMHPYACLASRLDCPSYSHRGRRCYIFSFKVTREKVDRCSMEPTRNISRRAAFLLTYLHGTGRCQSASEDGWCYSIEEDHQGRFRPPGENLQDPETCQRCHPNYDLEYFKGQSTHEVSLCLLV